MRAATKLMDRWKAVYAQKTDKRVLADAIPAAPTFSSAFPHPMC